MRILVTGGAGFIGSHITDALVGADHSVTVLDDLSSGRRENVSLEAHLRVMDIRSPDIETLFDEIQPEVVYHEAAQMDVRRSVADPVFDASVNVFGGLNLYEQCRRTGVKKIMLASTGGAIYGEQDFFPATESHPTQPVSPYGVAKLANEKYLEYYNAVYGLDSVCLRYANVYGPRQSPHGEAGVVAIFSDLLLKGKQPVIYGTGKQTRDYVFVGDVAQANLLALGCEGSDVLNVGTAIETDVNELFARIQTSAGTDLPEKHEPAKVGEQMRSVVSWEHINNRLGWEPKVALEDGINQTVDWFRTEMTETSD